MRAHKIQVQVPTDHHLAFDLPPSFPAGPAEVIVLTQGTEQRRIFKAGGCLSVKGSIVPGDPVADAIREIRSEHGRKVENLSADLEQGLK